MRLAVLLIGLLLSANGLAQSESNLPPLDEAFGQSVLIVSASKHGCIRFDVYVAESNSQRSRGLMFVRDMPDTTGMLFIYEQDGYLSMWMKNTFIPLDILFVRADGTVSSIAHNTEPQSLRSIAALEPVRYVLELNAGLADKYSIDKYSRLDWDGMSAVE
ncbi:MAG: DUF192 domain-containing protein [Woeseiaceae bacterium]